MNALAQIRALDEELRRLGVRLGRTGFLKKLCRSAKVLKQLDDLMEFDRLRLRRAQSEIAQLETAYFAEIQRARRDGKYPPAQTKPKKMEIL